MKKIWKSILCAAYAVLSLNLAAAAEKIMPVAFAADPPPEVDGSMERMAQLAGSVDIAGAKDVYYGKNAWSGNSDLSGKIVLGYDTANLYIAADVHDDKIVQRDQGIDLWKGDHVMLALQYPYLPARENKNNWCIVFSPGNFADIQPEAFIFAPANKDASVIRIAARRTAYGYKIEGAVPWTLLGKAPQKHDRLRFDLLLGDSDLPGQQETVMSASKLVSRGKPWNVGRLMEGVFAGGNGTYDKNKLARDLAYKSKIYTLTAKDNTFKFNIPAALAGKVRTLHLKAAMISDIYRGGSRVMQVRVDGRLQGVEDCLNREMHLQIGSRTLGSIGPASKWFVTNGNLEGKKYPVFYSAGVELDPCEYIFDITNKKQLEITYLPSGKNDLKFYFTLSEYPFQAIRTQLKPAPKGRLPFIEPSVPEKVEYQATLNKHGALNIKSQQGFWRINSEFSTLTPGWARLGGKGKNDGKVSVKGLQAELVAKDFKVIRSVKKLSDRIILQDRFINLTNNDLPLIYRYTAQVPDMQKAWVCGNLATSQNLQSSIPASPTALAVGRKGGLGILAGDDLTQLQSKWFRRSKTIGVENDHLVLTPKKEITVAVEIFPLEKADQWLFINRVRRALDVNFTVVGPGGFFSTRTTDPHKSLVRRITSGGHNIATLSVPFDYNRGNTGIARHGTKYAQTDVTFWDKTISKIKAAKPSIKVLPYYHCFISNGKGDRERFKDEMIIGPDGRQSDYRHGLYPLFVPYKGSKFAAAQEELLDLRFKHGADAIYWDEMEYSKTLFSYSDKYWDNVSGIIHPRTHKLIRKVTCIPILSEEWRVNIARKLIQRGNGLLVGNGVPLTKKMRALKTIRFVETGSISNLTKAQLYTPVSLGDHLTVRNEIDAYKDMLKALDYGCLYYYYRHTATDYPTLTCMMFPTTPVELGKGYIIGKERIITNTSGLFGWGDNSEFTVHIFDRIGKEDKKYKVPIVKKGSKCYAEIRIPEGYSAAIIRK